MTAAAMRSASFSMARVIERAERPAGEVDTRLDAVRRVVGHLVVVPR